MSWFNRTIAAVGRSLSSVGSRLEARQQSPLQQMLFARSAFLHGTGEAIPVNEKTAMLFSAVYASIRIIAETKASLPIKVYERLPGNRRAEATMHPVAELLHGGGPNPYMTPMVFNEVRQAHVLGWGNNFAEIELDGRGEILSLTPIHPSQIRRYFIARAGGAQVPGVLYYEVEDAAGGTRLIEQGRMLHVPGLGGNGFWGWSPIKMLAQSIGIGLANERYAATFFANSARPSLIVSHPRRLDDAAYARLKTDLETHYSGGNAHKPLLFEDGMTGNAISMPLNEAQFLESRKFQGEEIAARGYRLPPHVAGYLDRATFSNIEAQDLYFEKHTMRPWLERDEQELNRKLFSREERRRFYVKHNVDALLRADIKTRYEAHQRAILSGWKNVNEVREKEDLDPIGEQGDVYILPQNMTPAALLGMDKKSEGSGERSDPRLAALVEQTVRGLIQREVTQAQRAAKDPATFAARMDEFYEKHAGLVREKLGGVATNPGAIDAWLKQHRAQAAEGAIAGWPDEARTIAAELLGVTDISREME